MFDEFALWLSGQNPRLVAVALGALVGALAGLAIQAAMKLLGVRADRYGVYLMPAAVVAAATIAPREIYPIVEAAALRGWVERESRRLPYRVDEITTLTSFSFEQDYAVFHYDVRGSAVDPATFLTTVRAQAVSRADCRSLFGLAAMGISEVRHVYWIGGAEHSLSIASDDCGRPA